MYEGLSQLQVLWWPLALKLLHPSFLHLFPKEWMPRVLPNKTPLSNLHFRIFFHATAHEIFVPLDGNVRDTGEYY